VPIKLDLKPTLDEAAARRETAKAERVFANAGKNIGNSFSKSFTGGLQSASSDVQKLSREFQRMYDKAADSAGKLAVEERKLSEIRSKGVDGSRLVAQVEKTNAARRNEARQVREVAAAYKELQSAQRSSSGPGLGAIGEHTRHVFGVR
jgi:proline dehydrogenase